MKANTTNILLIVLIVILAWQNFFSDKEIKAPAPITVNIPEIKGTSGERVIERIVTQPVYIKESGETISVDSEWKRKYEEAKDSIEKHKQYIKAIKINKYEKELVNNDTIKITGYATTRGALLDYSVDYTIKSSNFSYIPDVVVRRPSLSMGIGVDAAVPTVIGNNFSLRGNIYFENRKGNGINLGYDTNKNVWIGVRKTFKLKK